MEPFIERMLERAKTKKEILKEQFHTGNNIRERWNLLKNANVLKQIEEEKQSSLDKSDGSVKKKIENINSTSNCQMPSKAEFKNLSQTFQLSGLVSSKILLFESKNMDIKTKIYTRASFIKRRAVFERNKEEVPLVKPKTLVTRSTLFEKSQEKVIESSSKIQHAMSYVCLSSDLSNNKIKVAESNACNTKYIDNACKEFITTMFDKNETKEDHYIENNGIDQETESFSDSIENTSFGSSIMHVFNELSLSNKLKNSAESNSTTEEYSVLNEIDQSLDEGLNAEELCNDDERNNPSLNTNAESITELNQDELKRNVIEEKIKKLFDEIYIQQKKIEGASKALNFIQSTDEFNNSTEQVEGEWALLVATHKRQAALNEVQRLKQEGTLRINSLEMEGHGSLTVSVITLPLNQEYCQKMNTNKHLHCVCLMSHLGEVVVTQAITAKPGDSCLQFMSVLKFDNICYNFRIDVEVYSFQTQPKFLSHEKKYHINRNIKAKNKSRKKKNQFIMPENLTEQNAIRSSVFQLMGATTIKLSDVNRKQFTLLGIPSHSPLEGHLKMHILSEPSESVDHYGFLTLFEDIANLGNWRRRWYRLKNARLYYWLNPNDEHEKNPIGYVDLESVFTKKIQFINCERYARPFTFLFEILRPAHPEDTDNLVMETNGTETIIKYYLLADTKEEGLQWISKLNKTLSLIRTWGPYRDFKEKI